MNSRLIDKVAIVTGGGRGIGKAIAEVYTREGAKVIVTAAQHEEEIKQTATAIGGTAILADVTSEKDISRLVKAVIHKFGRIDILVNNAARSKSPDQFWNIATPHQLCRIGRCCLV